MKTITDETHDSERRSFVSTANDPLGDFPIQNLPFGIFSRGNDAKNSAGVAIGDQIFDLHAASRLGLLSGDVPEEVFAEPCLNALFALGRERLKQLRKKIGDALEVGTNGEKIRRSAADLLVPMAQCVMHRPTSVPNYTDFYAGIHHAKAAGALLTPENPLPTNYKWVPIAYHGRASSVQVSGGSVRRPTGQRAPTVDGGLPGFGPCERLDFELEMGFYVSGGNRLGDPITVSQSEEHIIGYSLLNDWSARDVQRWEMYPLGPFLSKSFATSVSPWVVTADALAPFRAPAMKRPEGDPRPLKYLLDEYDQERGGLDIGLKVFLSTRTMRAADAPATEILRSNASHLYWTPAQMVAHHTVNGCNLLSGDLIGTGTISGPAEAELSSMLELTRAGARPITLPNGERRGFLLDGDEIRFEGRCTREGYVSIGFGACVGRIEGATEKSL
ncbi:fumarylacetoacetase [Bradyrhizobium sp. 23]|uniref:fumarylacetoacetase n=1 Tax=Bradyrhizobium sp. 23 TaxID=2782667 RepID=UPI001FF9596B|nr:fumarylacetoacetase [Bradyrhizobium sp. 23]